MRHYPQRLRRPVTATPPPERLSVRQFLPMKTITVEDLEHAADSLCRSARGRESLKDLLAFLDKGGLSLDEDNRCHIITLLCGAWGEFPGTARDVMRAKLGGGK